MELKPVLFVGELITFPASLRQRGRGRGGIDADGKSGSHLSDLTNSLGINWPINIADILLPSRTFGF